MFNIGDLFKIKECKTIDKEYVGFLVKITDNIIDSNGKILVHYFTGDMHIEFRCKIECLEKVDY